MPNLFLLIKNDLLWFFQEIDQQECTTSKAGVQVVVRCAIWYHLYNIMNVKNNRGGVLLLVKLQAKPWNVTKSSTTL